MKIARLAFRVLLIVAVLLSMAVLASLYFARIETTTTGVHRRLLVPLLGGGTAVVAMPAGTGDTPRMPGFLDGPVVQRRTDGSWSARWFCQDTVHQRAGNSATLVIDCAGRQHSFPIGTPESVAAPAVIATPAKMLVLSDIEGNRAYLEQALRNLGVMDAAGAWRYGDGQLVIAGDAVDRGRDVFAVLWRLYDLSLQARKAGGRVHLLLGNHEQYVLRGNTSRAHPEHVFGLAQLGGSDSAFAQDTVIGNWLRHQGVVLKAGKVLIAHGGISPAVAASRVPLARMNAVMQAYWQGQRGSKVELDAALGPQGVTQYRGYLTDMPGQYGRAADSDVDAALAAYGAEKMVVGHTIVDRVTSLYGGRVYAIDVNANSAATEALLLADGVAQVVDTRAPRNLPQEPRTVRPFDFFSGRDWDALGQMISRSYELTRLPHPY